MYTIIACIGKNNELGLNNKLIWHIKEDLEFFKFVTYNHYILMGRNTLLSLPKKLEGRKYLVISKTLETTEDYRVFKSIDELLRTDFSSENIYVIGGAKIYEEMMPYTDRMILTIVDDSHVADKYFPIINNEEFISDVIGEYHSEDLTYKRKIYTRKKED